MSKSPFSRGLNVKKSIFMRAIFKSGRFTRACKRRVATLETVNNVKPEQVFRGNKNTGYQLWSMPKISGHFRKLTSKRDIRILGFKSGQLACLLLFLKLLKKYINWPEQTRLRQRPCLKSWKTRLRCCWFIFAWI